MLLEKRVRVTIVTLLFGIAVETNNRDLYILRRVRKVTVLTLLVKYGKIKLSGKSTGADPGFFLGGGALVSCSTSTPINHTVFWVFFLAEYQLY